MRAGNGERARYRETRAHPLALWTPNTANADSEAGWTEGVAVAMHGASRMETHLTMQSVAGAAPRWCTKGDLLDFPHQGKSLGEASTRGHSYSGGRLLPRCQEARSPKSNQPLRPREQDSKAQ